VKILIINEVQCLKELKKNDLLPKTLTVQEIHQSLNQEAFDVEDLSFWIHIISHFAHNMSIYYHYYVLLFQIRIKWDPLCVCEILFSHL
jgi:hypothetical protein